MTKTTVNICVNINPDTLNYYKGLTRIPIIQRSFTFLPRVGEGVVLFPDGILSYVKSVEYTYTGEVYLVFETDGTTTDYDYYLGQCETFKK